MWRTGLVAPWHVGSSWTRTRTHVCCIGRWILNHCATREALCPFLNLCFLSVCSGRVLYVLDTIPLLDIRFANISSYSWVFFFKFIYFYFWLCWVFVSVRGLSLVVASGGHSSSRCAGLSLLRPLLLRSTGSRRAGSVVVAHGPSCSAACGIFPDQGSNPCPLHWQADSQPLHHQGSPSFS